MKELNIFRAGDWDYDRTLVNAFEQVVAAFPNNIAVEYGDSVLTYAELDAQANQIAQYVLCC